MLRRVEPPEIFFLGGEVEPERTPLGVWRGMKGISGTRKQGGKEPMSKDDNTELRRLIMSMVMTDLAVASLVNSVADKIDAMTFDSGVSLEALGEMRSLLADTLSHNSELEPLRYDLLSRLIPGIRESISPRRSSTRDRP